MINPDDIAELQNIKVPANMKAGQALKDFFLHLAETGPSAEPIQQNKDVRKVLLLLISSHLEVINAVGTMEESVEALEERLGNLRGGHETLHADSPF